MNAAFRHTGAAASAPDLLIRNAYSLSVERGRICATPRTTLSADFVAKVIWQPSPNLIPSR
jgi:hypothetical protein